MTRRIAGPAFSIIVILISTISCYASIPGPDACTLGWEECNRIATQQECERQGGSSSECLTLSHFSDDAVELAGPPDQEPEALEVDEHPESSESNGGFICPIPIPQALESMEIHLIGHSQTAFGLDNYYYGRNGEGLNDFVRGKHLTEWTILTAGPNAQIPSSVTTLYILTQRHFGGMNDDLYHGACNWQNNGDFNPPEYVISQYPHPFNEYLEVYGILEFDPRDDTIAWINVCASDDYFLIQPPCRWP